MVEVGALLLALVLVPLTGGSFKRLGMLEFDSPWMLFVGLGLQLVLELTPVVPESRADDLGFALLLASYALILSFCLLNLRITGMSVVTIGIALNVLVIGLNQGMPYRVPAGDKLETTVKHRPERRDDLLTVLDDRIVVPGPLSQSVSFGDLIIAAGIVNVTFRASRRGRRDRRVTGEPAGAGGKTLDLATEARDARAAERPRTPSGVVS